MLIEKLSDYRIFLVSKSPRRASLLQSMGIPFEVLSADVEETYDESLSPEQVAEHLSKIKLTGVQRLDYSENTIFITCDTIVVVGNVILGKPKSESEAVEMLKMLSGKEHKVITGVTVATPNRQITSHRVTKVCFSQLSEDEIDYYVRTYRPMDKAGAYGVQEWIGCVGIDGIEGSFYNVMGLPTKLLWEMLKGIIDE